MAVDFTTVDFSTLGDTFKKVTQHMKVSRQAQHGAAAWLRGGEGWGGMSPRVPQLLHALRLALYRASSLCAGHSLQGCFPIWDELMEKGQRLNRSFE